MAHSIEPGIPEAAIQKAVSVRQRRFDHALLHVDDEVLTVLGSLHHKKGMRLALVSNASTAEVQAWPASPLASLFDATVFSCHCGSMKPEPAIYQLALRELGLAPQSCLFVGDGGSNEHHGAHAVGMKPVLLRRYLQPPRHQQLEQELAAVLTASIDSLTELRDWF
jgi:putative hydrolase of the HAD superfamily